MKKITKGIRNPVTGFRYVTRHTINTVGHTYLATEHGGHTNALAEDWDNLFILDACRYDAFAHTHSLPGEVERCLSVGSGTLEWAANAIGGRTFHDTVYVTANPRINRYETRFHAVVPAWKTSWDERLKVVRPDTLIDVALQAYNRYPDKRIVVHFMQPHVPFIGEFGRSNVGIHDGTTKGITRARGEKVSDGDYIEPYDLLERGEVEAPTVKRAYQENLNYVLKQVDDLLTEVSGKTVVTSDHGEMFGERGWPIPKPVYGHPLYTPARKLLEVPWLVCEDGHRRRTVDDPPTRSEDIDDGEIEDRLEQLGYR